MNKYIRSLIVFAVVLLTAFPVQAQNFQTPYAKGMQYLRAVTERERLEQGTQYASRPSNHVFVPGGRWLYGVDIGYLGLNSDNKDMIFSGMKESDMDITGYQIQPYVGYAVANNCILGLRLGYGQMNGEKPFFPMYEGEERLHTFRNMDYTASVYSVDVFHRGYIPIDSRNRFALFGDLTLGYYGTNGHVTSQRDNEDFRSNFSLNQIRLGLRPGIAVAFSEYFSMDLSFGLANLSYTMEEEKNMDNPKKAISRSDFHVNSCINIADVCLGFTVNY